jgi:two-component system, cell cycle sensor histidine kinase and response regulator CckA
MPQDKDHQGTTPSPLPDVVKLAMDACPHGLKLRSGANDLYSNAAWARLCGGLEQDQSEVQPSRQTQRASFKLSFEGMPVEVDVIQDVTERRQLEAQLQEAQKLEALGRWVGSIVHDFRNLLTAVMLYSDLVAQTVSPGSSAAKYNDEVRDATKRGADLIAQLLSFARQRAPEVTELSLNSLLDGVRDVLRRMTGEDVELIFDLSDAQCRTRADSTQVQQVIFNLVVNSRQAMPEGGRIVIRTREISADTAEGNRRNGWAELTVSDDGVGMDRATLSRAFEPFFTTKPTGKGTGLGLSTVQTIVAQYGGSVSIDSQPGYGTTVTVLLPRAESGRSEIPCRAQTSELPGGSETILLVEDDSSVRASIGELLRQCGYRVIETQAGLEAIRASDTESGRIDLLLADMVLPGLSGREVARRLKLGRPDLRVLFISGYEPDQHHSDTSVFFKPFDKGALAHKVREVLDSSAPEPIRSHSSSV